MSFCLITEFTLFYLIPFIPSDPRVDSTTIELSKVLKAAGHSCMDTGISLLLPLLMVEMVLCVFIYLFFGTITVSKKSFIAQYS